MSSLARQLELGFVGVTEAAAVAAAHTMGFGERKRSDRVAVEAMREELGRLQIAGRVVIGEGERDKAPMLYVGEEVGALPSDSDGPHIDIAVDPLEGTSLCASGAAGAIAVLAAAGRGTGIHAVMGIGGAPEGVLTAAAMRCLGGQIHARLAPLNDEQRQRLADLGLEETADRLMTREDLAPGDNMLFCATGVTDGQLLRGARFFGGGYRTQTLFMSLGRKIIRFVDTIHRDDLNTPVLFR